MNESGQAPRILTDLELASSLMEVVGMWVSKHGVSSQLALSALLLASCSMATTFPVKKRSLDRLLKIAWERVRVIERRRTAETKSALWTPNGSLN